MIYRVKDIKDIFLVDNGAEFISVMRGNSQGQNLQRLTGMTRDNFNYYVENGLAEPLGKRPEVMTRKPVRGLVLAT